MYSVIVYYPLLDGAKRRGRSPLLVGPGRVAALVGAVIPHSTHAASFLVDGVARMEATVGAWFVAATLVPITTQFLAVAELVGRFDPAALSPGAAAAAASTAFVASLGTGRGIAVLR